MIMYCSLVMLRDGMVLTQLPSPPGCSDCRAGHVASAWWTPRTWVQVQLRAADFWRKCEYNGGVSEQQGRNRYISETMSVRMDMGGSVNELMMVFCIRLCKSLKNLTKSLSAARPRFVGGALIHAQKKKNQDTHSFQKLKEKMFCS